MDERAGDVRSYMIMVWLSCEPQFSFSCDIENSFCFGFFMIDDITKNFDNLNSPVYIAPRHIITAVWWLWNRRDQSNPINSKCHSICPVRRLVPESCTQTKSTFDASFYLIRISSECRRRFKVFRFECRHRWNNHCFCQRIISILPSVCVFTLSSHFAKPFGANRLIQNGSEFRMTLKYSGMERQRHIVTFESISYI